MYCATGLAHGPPPGAFRPHATACHCCKWGLMQSTSPINGMDSGVATHDVHAMTNGLAAASNLGSPCRLRRAPARWLAAPNAGRAGTGADDRDLAPQRERPPAEHLLGIEHRRAQTQPGC